MTRSIVHMPRFALTAACVLALAAPARAEIITVEYEAKLRPSPDAGWPADVVMSGTYSFDSETNANRLGAGTAQYRVLQFAAALDGIPFTAINPTIIVRNDARLENGLVRDNYLVYGLTQGTFKGITIDAFGLPFEWDGKPNSALTDMVLPLSEADLRFPPQSRQAIVAFRNPATGALSAISGVLTKLEFGGPVRSAGCGRPSDPFEAAVGVGRTAQGVLPPRPDSFNQEPIEGGGSAVTPASHVGQVRERDRRQKAGRTPPCRSSGDRRPSRRPYSRMSRRDDDRGRRNRSICHRRTRRRWWLAGLGAVVRHLCPHPVPSETQPSP